MQLTGIVPGGFSPRSDASGVDTARVSERNLEIVRLSWEAWGDRDTDRMIEFWDPAIEWDLSRFDEAPPDASFRGIGQVMTLIAQWLATWETYEVTVEEAVAAGELVLLVVRRRARSRETGEQADRVAAQVWTLRDERIVRIASYSDVDEARRAAGLA